MAPRCGGLGWHAEGQIMTLSGKEGPEPEAEGMTPRLAIAVSLIYCVTADKEVDAREVGRLVSAFGIPDERLRPLFEAILLKNDLKIFGQTSGQISDLGHAAAT
jgi:hypothetical protein